MDPTKADWLSAWSEFAAALFTLGAVVAAVAAGVIAHRVYKIESKREGLLELDRLQAQASQIAAWFEVGEVQLGPGSVSKWGARINNASQLPVYRMTIKFLHIDDAENAQPRAEVAIPLIAPGSVFVPTPHELRKDEGTSEGGMAIYLEPKNGFKVSIRFTDANGRLWKRGSDGSLSIHPSVGMKHAS